METNKGTHETKETTEEELVPEVETENTVDGDGEAKQADVKSISPAQRAEREILYMRAEFDNYKKRLIKEQEQAIKMGNRNFVSDLLSVLDLFEHAINHSDKLKAKGDADVTNFVTGIEMTRAELVQMMQRFGVELIGQPGEKFDPAKHEAISEVEAPEKEANTILSVVQKGCMLQGKLLKPARVVVVKAS